MNGLKSFVSGQQVQGLGYCGCVLGLVSKSSLCPTYILRLELHRQFNDQKFL